MAIKKSEIYSQIWAACDKLRGGVEPARYKDYILTLLFVKYVSDRFKSSDNWDIEVPEGGSFDDIAALKYKKNIGEGINIIIGKLAEANDLKGIIDIADFNSEELGTDKEAVDKLSGLVEIFQKPELDFTNNRAGGDDILGDVPFPVSWTVKMKKKQKETQDILSYHTQAAGCSDKARAKASGGRQPIEECGRTGL